MRKHYIDDDMIQWVSGFFAAAIVPTVVPTLYYHGISVASEYPNPATVILVAIVALLTTLGHLILLGIPGLVMLPRLRQFKGWTVTVLGFCLGCLPMAIWTWPFKASHSGSSSSHWNGEKVVHSMIDGVPTLTGWMNYMEGVLVMGALGLASGLSFWLAWWVAGGRKSTVPSR